MSVKIPHGEAHLICPMHKLPMSEVCHSCPWWTQLRGVNPNTGSEVDDWQCAVGWLPMLMIEVAQQARQGGAATESFRNEFVRMAEVSRSQGRLQRTPTPFLIEDTNAI